MLARLALISLVLPALAHAKPPPPPPPLDTGQTLRTQCLLHAADPKNPWALAHGITALGPRFAASDGRRAADVVVHDFVRPGGEEGPAWGFERMREDGTPIEPHANLLTKTLVHAGLKDTERFKTPHGTVTLGQLVKSVQAGFAHAPELEPYWVEVGWTLDLLASRLTPKTAKFKNARGQALDLNVVMDDALAYLERSQQAIAEGMDKGLPEVPKDKKGIYAHACGGLHLFQAVMHWARFPEVRKKWGKRVDRQLAVLFYRLGSEQRQYDAVLHAYPQHKLQILVQMVKFYGHFLETTGRIRKDKVATFDEAQRRQINKAKALLDAAVRGLEELRAWEKMDDLARAQRQIHLDLIGDACHAANGLQLWQ